MDFNLDNSFDFHYVCPGWLSALLSTSVCKKELLKCWNKPQGFENVLLSSSIVDSLKRMVQDSSEDDLYRTFVNGKLAEIFTVQCEFKLYEV